MNDKTIYKELSKINKDELHTISYMKNKVTNILNLEYKKDDEQSLELDKIILSWIIEKSKKIYEPHILLLEMIRETAKINMMGSYVYLTTEMSNIPTEDERKIIRTFLSHHFGTKDYPIINKNESTVILSVWMQIYGSKDYISIKKTLRNKWEKHNSELKLEQIKIEDTSLDLC